MPINLARQRERDIQMLARLEARIEERQRKSRNRGPKPPKLRTLDQIKAAGDFLDVHDLRRRGLFRPDLNWSTITAPARHPAVEKLVVARFRLQVHFRGRYVPQSIGVEWIPTPIYDRPIFRCDCGRRAFHLYPTGGFYRCRHCVMGGDFVRYKSRGKYYGLKRQRSRAPVAHGQRDRDPRTGRFVPTAASRERHGTKNRRADAAL